jgi:hypothetical protein
VTNNRKPAQRLRDIIQFAELIWTQVGKKERYILNAALDQRPLGSNNVKTLRRARDLIASAIELLPDHQAELLEADGVIASYLPEEKEAKAKEKKAAPKAQRSKR